MNRQKGIMLIAVSLIIIVFLVLLSAFLLRSTQESDLIKRQKENYEAFNLAEAGLDRAVVELKNDFDWSGISNALLGRGEYSVTVAPLSSTQRKVDCFGYIPQASSARQTCHIEASIKKAIPANFYENAIYSAEDIDPNGSRYLIDGKVRYAGEIDNTDHITGTITQDSSITPLARLDFSQLYTISAGQGNVYNAARLQDIQRGRDSFPTSFWYDQAQGVPNVVYVEEDLQLNGNIGTIGGFFVVAGDVLTDPSGGADSTINGNGQVAGCIYTLGEFTVNGGGGNLNIDGGVWSAEETGINGYATIQYNATYMQAIANLNINPDVQVVSWRQI